MAIQRMRLPSLAPVRQEMSGEIDGEWSYIESRLWWGATFKRRVTLGQWEVWYAVWVRFSQGQGEGWPYRLCLYYRSKNEWLPDGTQVAAVFLDHEARIKRTTLTRTRYLMPEDLARIGPRGLVAWAVDDARSVWSR